MELKVEVDYSRLKRRLAVVASKDTMRSLNRQIGEEVLELTKDHLDEMADEMAATRHKVADRLGAPHSKFLEYASGRMAGSLRNQTTELASSDEKSATIAIKNTPGLSRAWHDLHITPKKANALTLPLDRVSAHKKVADLRDEGHEIFHPKGTNILAETRGKGKNARLRPLYALVKSVTVPKDEGLLPTVKDLREWSTEAAENFFANASLG